MDINETPATSSSSWGLGKLTGFMKRLVGETPITEEELMPVIGLAEEEAGGEECGDGDRGVDLREREGRSCWARSWAV